MFASPIAAIDEMYSRFNAAFSTLTLVTTLGVELRWEGKEVGAIPNGYFARVSRKTVSTKSGGFLQNGEGQSPQVYDNAGLIFVQVFGPMSDEDSSRNAELLAIAARDIFRGAGTDGGVWFRNPRYEELGNDGVHWYFKVTVEFVFSET